MTETISPRAAQVTPQNPNDGRASGSGAGWSGSPPRSSYLEAQALFIRPSLPAGIWPGFPRRANWWTWTAGAFTCWSRGEETGKPTILLEAGIASFSSNWAWVQSELSASTRVVAYDRAGLGWSDPASAPQDAQQSAADLHAALQKAGISGPYVAAGAFLRRPGRTGIHGVVPPRSGRDGVGGRFSPRPVGAYPGFQGRAHDRLCQPHHRNPGPAGRRPPVRPERPPGGWASTAAGG